MYENNRKSLYRKHRASVKGLTLVEMIIALAMMGIVFAAIVPLFGQIRNSWDSKQAAAETLQNGRILVDHLNRTLSKAVRITAVSDPSQANGYIEFEDNDANDLRYDVNDTTSYVEYGYVGELYDLAGPASQLQFTCYDACDLDTPITDVNSIRFVKIETTLTNPTAMGKDKTLIASAYLRTNGNSQTEITKGTPFEYDTSLGENPAVVQIDSIHYLCAYSGPGDDGLAVVLTVDTDTWEISSETAFEYDETNGQTPALSQIDSTHYLCAYSGPGDDGWAVVLTVNTGTWDITSETPFEFDTDNATAPALAKIDDSHYLCVYTDKFSDGQALVLTVNTGTWDITKETPLEYDTTNGETPALLQIDTTHYLCVYTDKFSDGQALVLTVNTSTWDITKETPLEYDTTNGETPALLQIDSTHYLCAYDGPDSDGWAVVLTVNTGDWSISRETAFEYDGTSGLTPDLAQIDPNDYLCAYVGQASAGYAAILTVDPDDWTITSGAAFEYESTGATTPNLAQIDPNNYLCAYTGAGSDGWSVVLQPANGQVRP
ncbi:MAG TPA: prepilin-type N-terminal cleavage/methylation domain-containing protein [Sedimentisphaerales bacterium]|nr:prepilin-type N-terminal cleavage/methylation domain-containing protein [Sedimentisphaerales bacterium]